jgi:hypothetical protein
MLANNVSSKDLKDLCGPSSDSCGKVWPNIFGMNVYIHIMYFVFLLFPIHLHVNINSRGSMC